MDEVGFALDEGKRVIPVIESDAPIPLRLRRLQHIDFRPGYDAGLRASLHALEQEPQVSTPVHWDEATLERCRRSLADYVGPLAKIVVARASRQARSMDELRRLAAAEIPNEDDRRKFLASFRV
jgi:hypothetical protein